MITEKANKVSAQAQAVANNVQTAPSSVPNILLLEALERKCEELKASVNGN